MKTSERIRARLLEAGAPFKANDNIADFLEDGDREAIRAEVEGHMAAVLKSLVIDVENDHNTQETAKRIAKMFVEEVFAGRYDAMPTVTDFPNAKALDDFMVVGPIAVRSTCSHHFAPVLGELWVGVVPGERVIGLSKFSRLCAWIMSRPQIQEESVMQLADLLEAKMAPKGLALVVKASHACMTWRGVKDANSQMTTTVMRGVFREDASLRREFLSTAR